MRVISPVDRVGMDVDGGGRCVAPRGNVAELHAVVRVCRHHHVLGHRVELHVPACRIATRNTQDAKINVARENRLTRGSKSPLYNRFINTTYLESSSARTSRPPGGPA